MTSRTGTAYTETPHAPVSWWLLGAAVRGGGLVGVLRRHSPVGRPSLATVVTAALGRPGGWSVRRGCGSRRRRGARAGRALLRAATSARSRRWTTTRPGGRSGVDADARAFLVMRAYCRGRSGSRSSTTDRPDAVLAGLDSRIRRRSAASLTAAAACKTEVAERSRGQEVASKAGPRRSRRARRAWKLLGTDVCAGRRDRDHQGARRDLEDRDRQQAADQAGEPGDRRPRGARVGGAQRDGDGRRARSTPPGGRRTTG